MTEDRALELAESLIHEELRRRYPYIPKADLTEALTALSKTRTRVQNQEDVLRKLQTLKTQGLPGLKNLLSR